MTKLYLERVSETAIVPTKATTHAACYDIYADIKSMSPPEYIPYITLKPGSRKLIKTGFKMAADANHSIDFLPRSGLALKYGVTLANCIGIIDHDYKNECGIVLINHGSSDYEIRHGDRIGQLRLAPVIETEIIIGELPSVESNRVGGFGSTDSIDNNE